jgi:hypothetical protein
MVRRVTGEGSGQNSRAKPARKEEPDAHWKEQAKNSRVVKPNNVKN